MNLSQRAAKFIITKVINNLWGFTPSLMMELIERKGGMGSLFFVMKNMTHYESISKKMGPIPINILTTNISILNGCPYCIYGHALAFNLYYFEKYNELFKWDEKDFEKMARLSEEEKITNILSIYQEKRINHLLPHFETQLKLRAGAKPKNQEEKNIKFINTLYDYLNACGIESNLDPDEAHDPRNKNKALIEKYHQARKLQP